MSGLLLLVFILLFIFQYFHEFKPLRSLAEIQGRYIGAGRELSGTGKNCAGGLKMDNSKK